MSASYVEEFVGTRDDIRTTTLGVWKWRCLHCGVEGTVEGVTLGSARPVGEGTTAFDHYQKWHRAPASGVNPTVRVVGPRVVLPRRTES